MYFYTYKRGILYEKIFDIKFFEIFKKKSKKWPTQNLSNGERNKVMKNQPIQGILWRISAQ